MLNVGADEADRGSAILIRACEPIAGLPVLKRRRGLAAEGPILLTGPGKVAQALGLDGSFSGKPLFMEGGLEVRAGEAPKVILAGPRVGIDYAEPRDRAARLRFASAGTKWVTMPKGLSPEDRSG